MPLFYYTELTITSYSDSKRKKDKIESKQRYSDNQFI